METETSLLASESIFIKIHGEGCSLSSNYMDSNDDLRNELRSLSWDQLITHDLEDSSSSVGDMYEKAKLTKDEAFKLLNMAAVLLQRNVRRYLQQKKYRDFLLAYRSAVKIQSAWRGYRTRNLDLKVVKLKHDYMTKVLQTQMSAMKASYQKGLDMANKDKSLLIQIVSVLSMELEKVKGALDNLKISSQETFTVLESAPVENCALEKEALLHKEEYHQNNSHLYETDSGVNVNMSCSNGSVTEKGVITPESLHSSNFGAGITASAIGSDQTGHLSTFVPGSSIPTKNSNIPQLDDVEDLDIGKSLNTSLTEDYVPPMDEKITSHSPVTSLISSSTPANSTYSLSNVLHDHINSNNSADESEISRSVSSSVVVEEYIDNILQHLVNHPAPINQPSLRAGVVHQTEKLPPANIDTSIVIPDPIRCRTPSILSVDDASILDTDSSDQLTVAGTNGLVISLSDKTTTVNEMVENNTQFMQADSVEFLNDSLLGDDRQCTIRDNSDDSILEDALQADSLQFVNDSLQVD